MRRINMGSNATLIAVASIPPRIWEMDKDAWKAWVMSLNVSFHTKEVYKRSICAFYSASEKSIREVTEEDFQQYEALLRADGRPESYIKQHMSPVKTYWRFTLRAKAAGEVQNGAD